MKARNDFLLKCVNAKNRESDFCIGMYAKKTNDEVLKELRAELKTVKELEPPAEQVDEMDDELFTLKVDELLKRAKDQEHKEDILQ